MADTMVQDRYAEAARRIRGLCAGEDDRVTLMATVACELRLAFPERFHWIGFYRVVAPGLLKIGPYQGGHGLSEHSLRARRLRRRGA